MLLQLGPMGQGRGGRGACGVCWGACGLDGGAADRVTGGNPTDSAEGVGGVEWGGKGRMRIRFV